MAHTAHVDAPAAAATLPCAQSSHVDAAVAPVASENLPVLHAVHVAVPSLGAYLPGRQAVQVVARPWAKVPGEQMEQALWPGEEVKRPTGQGWHVLPSVLLFCVLLF